MTRMHVRFVGRVQGVGFRATASAVASRWPVTGWVRNEPDGSVRMEVQGAERDVHSVLGALQDRMADLISQTTSETTAPVHGERGFVIRR